jgi:hypothetical protein
MLYLLLNCSTRQWRSEEWKFYCTNWSEWRTSAGSSHEGISEQFDCTQSFLTVSIVDLNKPNKALFETNYILHEQRPFKYCTFQTRVLHSTLTISSGQKPHWRWVDRGVLHTIYTLDPTFEILCAVNLNYAFSS